jgi:predicted aspartyl protease
MRNHSLSALLLATLVLFFANLSASAQSSQPVTVSMRPYKGDRAIVAIKINGAGPYDFMVDTGATASILDAALFQELGLKAESTVIVRSVAGTDQEAASSIKEISLDGVSVQNVRVLRVEKLPLGSEYRGVRGVLGENFLQHFDILIDNQHHKMTLDAGTALAESLGGERLPVTFPPVAEGQEMRYRPLVSVTVSGYDSHPIQVLLDSGADHFVLVGAKTLPVHSQLTALKVGTVNGSMNCMSSENDVRWGKATATGVSMVMCQSAIENGRDYAGTLPTTLFHQIFLSHAGAYVIVNPGKAPHAPQEVAAVTPLAR